MAVKPYKIDLDPEPIGPLVTASELSERSGLDRGTIRRLSRLGSIPRPVGRDGGGERLLAVCEAVHDSFDANGDYPYHAPDRADAVVVAKLLIRAMSTGPCSACGSRLCIAERVHSAVKARGSSEQQNLSL